MKLLCKLGQNAGKDGNDKQSDETNAETDDEQEGKRKENKDKENRTKQVLVFSKQELKAIPEAAVKFLAEHQKGEKKTEKALLKDLERTIHETVKGKQDSVDIALFGRMATSDAFQNVEAAMQVAHAFSTHKVAVETDYFTAVDDLVEKGSAHINEADFDSACYYLYASLDTDKLRENLKDFDDPDAMVIKVTKAILQVMAFTNPSGKQNTFAGHVLPSAVLVECREQKIPVSMANAYAYPVWGENLIKKSIQELVKEVDTVQNDFGLPVMKRFWFCSERFDDVTPPMDAEVCNFCELVDKTVALLR